MTVRGTPYWMFCLPPPDLPPNLPPVMFHHTFHQPHWHLTSLSVPQHLTTPCGTSPASIWPSDLPRSFRSRDTIPPLVPSSPIMPCPTAAPHVSPPPSSAALSHLPSVSLGPTAFRRVPLHGCPCPLLHRTPPLLCYTVAASILTRRRFRRSFRILSHWYIT